MLTGLYEVQFITVVKTARGGGSATGHQPSTIGCRVGIQQNPAWGIRQSGWPMFSAKVKWKLWARTRSSTRGLGFRRLTCVNIGSLSIKTLFGIASYSGRSQPQPETFTNMSAPAQMSSASARVIPW